MAFTPQFLDELKMRTSLSGVIGKHLKLVRKGKDMWACCPFHNEKTPSFHLEEQKGFYHCFGCGESGSAIDFVMKIDGLSFPEAVRNLAESAGMEIPIESPEEQERAQRAENLYEVMELATIHFEKLLRMPEGREALTYLQKRGLGDSTIKKYRLGFSADRRDGLKGALTKEGATEGQMLEAGLIIQPDDQNRKPYDRFRGRVMFPITDTRSRVVAFGGRILKGDGPKYLNSPETPLFHKGRTVYALAQARDSARKKKEIIVAEGYMDVIALSQGGFENAVAPLGTALTEEQIALLWRVEREPVLCFDGDTAGQRAAGRAAERALPHLKAGYGLKFVIMPEGEDPDTLIQKQGPQAMQALLDESFPLSEQIWRMEGGNGNITTPEQKGWLEKRLKDHAFSIEDKDLQSHYLNDIKDRLWKMGRQKGGATKSWSSGNKGRKAPWQQEKNTQLDAKSGLSTSVDRRNRHEQILLATLITHPDIADDVAERLGYLSFSSPDLDKLRQEVLKTLAEKPTLDFKTLADHLNEMNIESGDRSVNFLLSAAVFGHAGFARPERSQDDALKGWEQTFRLYGREELQTQIRDAQRRLEDNPSDETYAALRTLREMEQQLAEDDSDDEF
ncbi:MAG: DNA primase [Rhodospirillales bacterium]|nr:DNA primase [Rhodospirillales bacterium]